MVLKGKDVPCADCGLSFPPEAMDYDHVPGRGDKLFRMSNVPRCADPVMVKREMAKCDVVCSNCHRVRTSSRKGTRRPGDPLDRLRRRISKYDNLSGWMVADRIKRREAEREKKSASEKFRSSIGPQVLRRRSGAR